MAKRLTDAERETLAKFTVDHSFCWACGHSGMGWSTAQGIDYPRNLERAHIIGGAGRKHDRRNLALLCKLCHDLSHGMFIRKRLNSDRELLPHLRRDHLLWLKVRFDGRVDRKYLREIAGKRMPPVVVVPVWYQREFFKRQQCTHSKWNRARAER